MKARILAAAVALTMSGAAWAKLPPPPPADPAKAAEAKAKTDEAAAKEKAQLTGAQDRAAARYIKEQKAKGVTVKPTPIAAAAPAAAAAKPAASAKK